MCLMEEISDEESNDWVVSIQLRLLGKFFPAGLGCALQEREGWPLGEKTINYSAHFHLPNRFLLACPPTCL